MTSGVKDLAVTKMDAYLFGQGTWYQSYKKLGAHQATYKHEQGYYFAVWAPHAAEVAVVGDFNDWQVRDQDILTKQEDSGIWQGFVAGVEPWCNYKYLITTKAGEKIWKTDPYASYAEVPPHTASVTCPDSDFTWTDSADLSERARKDLLSQPINIYEVHLGSWKRHINGSAPDDPNPEVLDDIRPQYLSYTELADELIAYVKKMNYTHIELLPVMEHPFDGSWGYQVTSYYAPSSRYGRPDEFRALVNAAHKAGIGVILDWVPGGFCPDAHGLCAFDGEKLYESEIHPNWGTYRFDLAKPQVQSFLISNALYWLEEFHADGLRVDGVTSMLYLNFGVDNEADKKFNKFGTEENLEAIEFIRTLNTVVGTEHPDCMMIAEESTAWPLVTYPPKDGGLGFNFKWDMGWMHDTLHYCQTDFPYRPGNHRLLTFSTMYQFNENFILSLSHDEVVHGKCSLITRQPGDYWRQFAGLRSLALYQMTHVGAKLNFMGNEIGQFIEWRYYEGIEFFLTEHAAHASHQHFISKLNEFYKAHKALWENGFDPQSFEWIDADNANQSIISFIRRGKTSADDLIVLINFDVNPHVDFLLGVPEAGVYEEVFNSDDTSYGGSGVINTGELATLPEGWNGRPYAINLRVPPLAGVILKRTKDLPHVHNVSKKHVHHKSKRRKGSR